MSKMGQLNYDFNHIVETTFSENLDECSIPDAIGCVLRQDVEDLCDINEMLKPLHIEAAFRTDDGSEVVAFFWAKS